MSPGLLGRLVEFAMLPFPLMQSALLVALLPRSSMLELLALGLRCASGEELELHYFTSGGASSPEPPVFVREASVVFTDGSARSHVVSELAIATFSALQLGLGGELLAGLTGRVPPYLDQSAAAGERFARALAMGCLSSEEPVQAAEATRSLLLGGYPPLDAGFEGLPTVATDCLSLLALKTSPLATLSARQP